MHSKETVVYICEEYLVTGHKLFFKQELLTSQSHADQTSVYWSRRKPITDGTFRLAQQNGYTCHIIQVHQPPAQVLPLPVSTSSSRQSSKRRQPAHPKQHSNRTKTAFARFLTR
ncbi:MAG: hypothetical protein OWT28_13605 [Firmicutes bacterium]|nr:hypothetical protein [Bacillota bacterium]